MHPIDIFADEDISDLTILEDLSDLEYEEEDKPEVTVLEPQGSPRETKPLKWTADIYVFDIHDPGRTLVVRTKDIQVPQLPTARPRKNESTTDAALRALEDATGIELSSADLVSRYISRIDLEEESYMRTTWVVPYDIGEFEPKNLDDMSYVDAGMLSELINSSSLGTHYYNLVDVIASAPPM